jgi:2-C-methyl-D-erythritol 4-phosphate cytidylyltransferase
MGSTVPKQYLPLAGKTILEHTLKPFCEHSAIHSVVVVVAENDKRWKSLPLANHPKVHATTGGLQRYHSVLNGLKYIQNLTNTDDWVLVHDAARPCVRSDDIDSLIAAADTCTDGAILGLPVRDTMKRADNDRKIHETVNRDNLWHALTPQLFRLSVLRKAIENTIVNSIEVTDEAQAVEMMGLTPLLVEGHPDNIKITHPSDLALAELYLAQQENL